MTPADVFARCGKALCGDDLRWKEQFAALLGIKANTVDNMAKGTTRVPPGVWTDVARAIRKHERPLAALHFEAKRMAIMATALPTATNAPVQWTRILRNSVPAHEGLFPGQLLALAEQYLAAFKASPAPGHNLIFWPAYQNLGHAVELCLKAYLAWSGKTEGEVREYGHDIRELVKDAIVNGLVLSADDRGRLEWLDDIHAEFWARYPKNHADGTTHISEFEPTVHRLFEDVRKHFGGRVYQVKI